MHNIYMHTQVYEPLLSAISNPLHSTKHSSNHTINRQAMPYADYVFANESEAAAYGELKVCLSTYYIH